MSDSSVALVHYDAARAALAQAVRVDEVAKIRNLAVAAQAYAQQAQNFDMINNATEIRERAERRAGELLRQMKEQGERDTGQGGDRKSQSQAVTVKLSDLDVTKKQSSRWQAKARMTDEQFEKHLDNAKRRAVNAGRTNEAKQERRAARERELAEATTAAATELGHKVYGVIYADPPWRFEPYSRDTGLDRAADNHYPTMTLDDIKAVPVPAAPDCALFLWATVPLLPQALDVLGAWGFDYRSHFVWAKHRAGTGYWNRNKHELLLIGTRGNIPAPAAGEQHESVIEAQAVGHSIKPFHFREIIEEMYPNIPRIELFARQRWAGWDSWGNEIPKAA